jgi:hypothetical protein
LPRITFTFWNRFAGCGSAFPTWTAVSQQETRRAILPIVATWTSI